MFCIDGASYIHGITSKCLYSCKSIFSFNFISGYDEIHMYEFKVLIRIFLIIIYYTFALHLARGFSFFFFLQGRIVILQGDSVSTEISVAQCLITGTCFTLFVAILYPFFSGKNNGQISHLKKCYPTLLQKNPLFEYYCT